MVSDSLRDSRDLPKIRNKIFEESLESQEISYYIDDVYDDPKSDNEADSDSFESETETEASTEIGSRHNLDNIPLPLPPSEPNTLVKLAENVKKIRKTISKDFSKSIRRISRKIGQTDSTTQDSKASSRLFTAREEPPADIIQVRVMSSTVTRRTSKRDDDSKPPGLLSRIRRSMSLSAESVPFTFSSRNDSQRRSTFYLTDPINIDGTDDVNEVETCSTISNHSETIPEKIVERVADSPPEINRNVKRSKLIRPKSPPPPIPIVIEQSKDPNPRSNSLYGLPGLLRIPTHKSENRKTWYAETTKLSPSSENGTTPTKTKTYSNVIEELNFKLNGNVIEDFSSNMENENTYNNQSIRSFGSSKTDESSVIMDPALEFLHDEPLYQFYDAAVLESLYSDESSDFEDDVYEDVVLSNEDNVSKEFEFMNPNLGFTRSLWCEIPEVKNSAVLSQLSAQQKKLQEAKFEVITSEASYLNSLNVLSNHFVPSFKKSNIINEKELEILFGKLKGVRNSSKKMLHDLERCWKNNILMDGICDTIQKHAQENFDSYIPYCENQIIINDTLSQMKDRSGFNNFLSTLESSSSCQYLSLYSFLMLPMQRITRWPLLVDAILKRLSESDPEYLTCQQALTTLNKIVSQCNEAARTKEREVELVKISNTLNFPKGVPYVDIIADNRWLLRSGALVCLQPRNDDGIVSFVKKFNKLPLTLFLFNDLFLVTKKESDAHTVLHYCPRNLIELRDIDTYRIISRKDINEKNVLYLCLLENQDGRLVEFLLSSSSETDKERWIEAFSPPKSENPDETLYECWDCPQVTVLHNYNGCQPDELSLARGDVINVLRKMSDGWYHGERLRDGVTGWFPSNYTVEIINPHVRARNLKQRYRLLTFSENYLKS